jgi:S-DNA-T family DNA segregation ATPase FtsK/SpoIIIE
MYSVINSRAFRECKFALPMALGATINNDIFIADLTRMPHLLVAGATGQGKSVGLNCIIASLLYKKHPGELKFVLIDPKMVEFSLYSRIERHYLAKLPDEEEPIVTEPSKALTTLSSICIEMDNRYDLLKAASVRTVEEYNAKFARRVLNPEKGHKYLPYIVVVVDEFADLIMTAGKDISLHIARIAQKARAVGIHMIIATQRPSTDIITGMIKANFPGRIAFRVASMVDSKTILDRPGANRLIGRGDLLFSHNSRMERVQCAFIDTPEVEAIVDHIEAQIGYPTAYLLPEPQNDNALTPGAVDLSKRDELFDDCARFVTQNSTASTSSLQRRFGIGYNKAGKIMDQLEAAGIVGPADGQKPRAVLVDSMAIEDMLRSL